MRKALLASIASLLALNLFAVAPSFAQGLPPSDQGADMTITLEEAEANDPGPRLDNPLGTDDVREVIARIILLMTGISGSLALAVFVYGGFNWVIAGGNDERIKKGKQAFKYGALGLVIIFGSYVAVRAVYQFIGQAAG